MFFYDGNNAMTTFYSNSRFALYGRNINYYETLFYAFLWFELRECQVLKPFLIEKKYNPSVNYPPANYSTHIHLQRFQNSEFKIS